VTSTPLFEPPSRAYRGFIFDCDGTLADSMPLHHEAWRVALLAHGARFDFGWELFVRRAGMTIEATVAELNVEFGTQLDPVSVARRQRAEYEARLPQIRPLTSVVEYLRAVAGHSPVSVASGSERGQVLRTLEVIGILPLVPIVVTAAEVARGKPFPDLFLLAAEKMGVLPADCVVFEDAELGILAAERAGMGSVRVSG
jgi:beta-phosphoglucomutase-like phosphatase (HAD superfamily)